MPAAQGTRRQPMTSTPRAPNTEHRTPSSTAAAILTPLGHGGIAILHVLGPRAFDVASQVFRPKSGAPLQPDARRLLYGHVVDNGEVVDEVLVRLVPANETRSQEPTVEINCHGGLVAVQRVLECLARRGVEPIEPDALIRRRARSQTEAEAAHALTQATTPLGVETLLDQLNGALEAALRSLPWHQPSEVATALRDLLATERLGHAFWRPPRVAVVGPTNAGKSTLFNALAREERMIVSPQPGTTRDAVSAEVAIGGLPVWLTDTAGEREPGSIIEVEAVARSRSAAAEAALVLLVFDGSAPPPIPLATLQAAIPNPQLLILNKADLGLAPWTRDLVEAIEVSAIRGTALDELCRRIVETLVGEARYEPGRPVLFTLRQAGLVREALSALEAGDLDAAQAHVSEIL